MLEYEHQQPILQDHHNPLNLATVKLMTTDYIRHLEELRRINQERLQSSSIYWNNFSNTLGFELNKLLITLATITIPLSLLPLTNKETISVINMDEKKLFFTSLVSLFLSIVFGLIHMYKESEFFDGWAKQENKRAGIFSEDSFVGTNPTEAFNKFTKMINRSRHEEKMILKMNQCFLYLQESFVGFGIFVLLLIFYKILFKQ